MCPQCNGKGIWQINMFQMQACRWCNVTGLELSTIEGQSRTVLLLQAQQIEEQARREAGTRREAAAAGISISVQYHNTYKG